MKQAASLADAMREFGLVGTPVPLTGGSQTAYRVGDVVLKHVGETSLENNGSPILAQWIAEFTGRLAPGAYRLPQPIKTTAGRWITKTGWTASSFMAGRPATPADVPQSIDALNALHRSLAVLGKHPYLDKNETAWGIAHRASLDDGPGTKPASRLRIPPQLREHSRALEALRRPIRLSKPQVIHGDLNPQNILIADGIAHGQPPAFLDFSPFWAPSEFALAMFANWIGPREGDASVLADFSGMPHFPQLLLRASLRRLYVRAVSDRLEDWATSSEKAAAEIVIEYVKNSPVVE
jgi:hypothetical protein